MRSSVCPDCRTAELVRESVAFEGFLANAFVASLPLFVVVVTSVAVYRVGARPRREGRS